ncbi:MAG TPA: hypothetical protein VF407_23735 [Polyangiaceae bacterium]
MNATAGRLDPGLRERARELILILLLVACVFGFVLHFAGMHYVKIENASNQKVSVEIHVRRMPETRMKLELEPGATRKLRWIAPHEDIEERNFVMTVLTVGGEEQTADCGYWDRSHFPPTYDEMKIMHPATGPTISCESSVRPFVSDADFP